MNFPKNILCIGPGYVGTQTILAIARHCSQYRIAAEDI
jgi:hypothetical protein